MTTTGTISFNLRSHRLMMVMMIMINLPDDHPWWLLLLLRQFSQCNGIYFFLELVRFSVLHHFSCFQSLRTHSKALRAWQRHQKLANNALTRLPCQNKTRRKIFAAKKHTCNAISVNQVCRTVCLCAEFKKKSWKFPSCLEKKSTKSITSSDLTLRFVSALWMVFVAFSNVFRCLKLFCAQKRENKMFYTGFTTHLDLDQQSELEEKLKTCKR